MFKREQKRLSKLEHSSLLNLLIVYLELFTILMLRELLTKAILY